MLLCTFSCTVSQLSGKNFRNQSTAVMYYNSIYSQLFNFFCSQPKYDQKKRFEAVTAGINLLRFYNDIVFKGE